MGRRGRRRGTGRHGDAGAARPGHRAAPRPCRAPSTPRGPLGAEELAHIELFRKASPSVVHITTLETQRDFFSLNVQQVPRGTGTGFVWDERGHIVTNFHVIQGGSGARVTLADQSTYPAKLVGAFPDRDLAVLKIDAPAGQAAADRAGQQPRPAGRPARLRDRQPVRPRPDADHRHRQRAQPRDRVVQPAHHPRRDPDRRGHQPRQLRRPAARLGRPADRRQHADRQPERRLGRHRLRDPGRRGQPHRAAADPRRPLRAPGHRRERRAPALQPGLETAQGRGAGAGRCRQPGGACRPAALPSRCQGRDRAPAT